MPPRPSDDDQKSLSASLLDRHAWQRAADSLDSDISSIAWSPCAVRLKPEHHHRLLFVGSNSGVITVWAFDSSDSSQPTGQNAADVQHSRVRSSALCSLVGMIDLNAGGSMEAGTTLNPATQNQASMHSLTSLDCTSVQISSRTDDVSLVLAAGCSDGHISLWSCRATGNLLGLSAVRLFVLPNASSAAAPVAVVHWSRLSPAAPSQTYQRHTNHDTPSQTRLLGCTRGADIVLLQLTVGSPADPSKEVITLGSFDHRTQISAQLTMVTRRNAHAVPICALEFITTEDPDVVGLDTAASTGAVSTAAGRSNSDSMDVDAANDARPSVQTLSVLLLSSSPDGQLHVWRGESLARCKRRPLVVTSLLQRMRLQDTDVIPSGI